MTDSVTELCDLIRQEEGTNALTNKYCKNFRIEGKICQGSLLRTGLLSVMRVNCRVIGKGGRKDGVCLGCHSARLRANRSKVVTAAPHAQVTGAPSAFAASLQYL
jgi:hypothetical protein